MEQYKCTYFLSSCILVLTIQTGFMREFVTKAETGSRNRELSYHWMEQEKGTEFTLYLWMGVQGKNRRSGRTNPPGFLTEQKFNHYTTHSYRVI